MGPSLAALYISCSLPLVHKHNKQRQDKICHTSINISVFCIAAIRLHTSNMYNVHIEIERESMERGHLGLPDMKTSPCFL